MSKLATFQQAKKLKELGYDSDRFAFRFDIVGDMVEVGINYEDNVGYKVFYISEALEWFREVKELECEVCLRLCFMGDTGEAVFGGYEYIIFEHDTGKTISSTKYYDRSFAESALLNALIEYVSK